MPRHKQSAVARNKVKRRLRELSRAVLLPALMHAGLRAGAPALDVVLRAAPEAYGAEHAALAADVQRVLERLAGTRA